MLLEELNWMQVEEYLSRDNRIILVTGACEQHGYLSLLTDVRIPMAIARAVAAFEGVLVAPPLPFGVSPQFAAYPGTISLGAETLLRVVGEVVAGLHAQGFRRILVLNGHGGNKLGELFVELANALPGLKLDWLNWWQLPEVERLAAAHGLATGHANWMESFPFTRVKGAAAPDSPKPPVTLPAAPDAAAARALLGDGSFGGAYQAPPEVMGELLSTVVEVASARLRAL